MNYRPYPDVDRALAQLERHRVHAPLAPSYWITTRHVLAAEQFAATWRQFGAIMAASAARQTGKKTVTAVVVDQALRDGEHVHVAGQDGVRCAGGDEKCTLPRRDPDAEVTGR